jgi:serine/threonine-protein kinase RIM15
MESPAPLLVPPAVTSLRTQPGQMERSLSQDIRDEREELREAAESTLNAIIDLNLDGTVKWASPSWTDLVGTKIDSLSGVLMSDLVVSDNKNIFSDVVDSMKRDDSKSHRVRFTVQLGPLSKLRNLQVNDDEESEESSELVELEAQGIMVYDSVSGGESHVSTANDPGSVALR